ncbi:MAG: TraB/GumN family protein [Bacteroidota bacterium]
MPKIGEISAEKSTFYGVGAGHLPGENGVISLLKKAGYQVTPVK